MNDFAELKREGLSIQAISSSATGFDRKTVRKYLLKPDAIPAYGPRPPAASKLDDFKAYLEERLKAGVWNAAVLLRDLKARSYSGGYPGCPRPSFYCLLHFFFEIRERSRPSPGRWK